MLRPHYFSRYFIILVPSSLNLCSIFTKVPVFKFRISIRACSYLKVRQSNTPVVIPTKIFLEESLVAPFTEGSKQHFYPKRVLCGLCSVTDFIVIYRIRKNSILLNLNGTKRSRNAIYFPSKQLGASKGPLGSFLTLQKKRPFASRGLNWTAKVPSVRGCGYFLELHNVWKVGSPRVARLGEWLFYSGQVFSIYTTTWKITSIWLA